VPILHPATSGTIISTKFHNVTSLVVLWSGSLTTNHEVPGSIPGSTVGIFPEGENSRGDHGLGSLVEFRFNPLTLNDDSSGRTAPLISKHYILYIYSTHIGTEYFKHDIHSPFFPLKHAVCFINLTYLVPVLFTFYIQDVLKLKK